MSLQEKKISKNFYYKKSASSEFNKYIDIESLEREARLDFEPEHPKSHDNRNKVFTRDPKFHLKMTSNRLNKLDSKPKLKYAASTSTKETEPIRFNAETRKPNLENQNCFNAKQQNINHCNLDLKNYEPANHSSTDYHSYYEFLRSKKVLLSPHEKNRRLSDYADSNMSVNHCISSPSGSLSSPSGSCAIDQECGGSSSEFQYVTVYKLKNPQAVCHGSPRLKTENGKLTYFYEDCEKSSKSINVSSSDNNKKIGEVHFGTWPALKPRYRDSDETEKLLRQFRQTAATYRSRLKEIQAKTQSKIEKAMFDFKVDLVKSGGKKYYQVASC